jgi:hypothetical protein
MVTGGISPNAAGRVAPFAATMTSASDARRHRTVRKARNEAQACVLNLAGHNTTRLTSPYPHATHCRSASDARRHRMVGGEWGAIRLNTRRRWPG